MSRKSFRLEEVIAKLREADVLLGQGKKVGEVVKALGVSEVAPGRAAGSGGLPLAARGADPDRSEAQPWTGAGTTTRSGRTRRSVAGRRRPRPSRGRDRRGRRPG